MFAEAHVVSDATRLSVRAKPIGARLVDESLESLLAKLLAARDSTAHAAGARAELERAAGALDRACARLDSAREAAAAEMAQVAVELALAIARQILRTEIAAGRHDMEAIVREALAVSGAGRSACVVHVHPRDAEALANVRFRSATKVECDETVARGDAHISTPRGLLVRETDEALRMIDERLRAEAA